MARDITGRAVDRYKKRHAGALARFRNMVPAGPTAELLTPAALGKKLGSMSGDERIALSRLIGEDKMLELMKNAS